MTEKIKTITDNEVSTWQDKAEWLRIHGYFLSIDALDTADIDGNKWMAAIEGQGRRYTSTIEEAVEQVYEWVISEYEAIMSHQNFLICDFCNIRVNETEADSWLSVKYLGNGTYMPNFNSITPFSPPGDYCSILCLRNHLTRAEKAEKAEKKEGG
jgi:hypothetical protein